MKDTLKKSFLYKEVRHIKHFINNIGSKGYVFMLHRVGEIDNKKLFANENMKISPLFLDSFIKEVQKSYDIIPSTEIRERLSSNNKRKFVVFTMDDGYKDNYTEAFPVFKKNNAPFTVFLASSYPQLEAVNWWYSLEDLLLENDSVQLTDGSVYDVSTKELKESSFMDIRAKILKLDQQHLIEGLNQLFGGKYQINWYKYNKNLCMSWDDVAEMLKEPLVSIGAHTYHHYNLKALETPEDVKNEVTLGLNVMADKLNGFKPSVFAYPFGSLNEAGEREIKVLSEMNFKNAFLAYSLRGGVKLNDNPYAIPRIMLTENFNLRDYVGAR